VDVPRVRHGLAVMVAPLTLAGCAGTPAEPQAAPAGEGHNSVDVMFAQMMIPHHDDAIAMVRYLQQSDGVDRQVDPLAGDITEAQVRENVDMNTWLGEQDYPQVPSVPGQVNHQSLAGASPAEVEEVFLTEMIAHHEHGLDMARSVVEREESPVMTDLSQTMVEDQSQEIETMRDLLAKR